MAETVPSYAAKMAKVEAASGVLMEVMIFIVGPSAALQNSCSTPWKMVEVIEMLDMIQERRT